MSLRYSVLLALACVAAAAGPANAKGRLDSVVPIGVACVQVPQPDDPTDQFWEVQAGKSYTCKIVDVTDCANGGTDATIGIRVNATGPGSIDLVATRQEDGVYVFTIPVPVDNPSCTLPLFYCTPPGSSDPGLRVLRDKDDNYPAHLRIAEFAPPCENPTIPACATTPTRSRTWAQVKQIYR